MNQKNVIAVFGGCFNPPLNSHFSLADQIINEYEFIKKIIFVPVNSKYNKLNLLSNEHRYNMLKIICDKNPGFVLSRIEIDSEVQLYTIETLKKVQEIYPEATIWFIIGTDNLKQLGTWKKSDDLVKNFKILVLERDNDTMEEIIKNDEFLNQHSNAFIKAKNTVKSNMSSTFVRDKIKQGKSIRYLVPDEIYAYIINHNLFKK